MGIRAVGAAFYLWKKPGRGTSYYLSSQAPKPGGLARIRGAASTTITAAAAEILCGGMPPKGERVYMLRTDLLVADTMKIA